MAPSTPRYMVADMGGPFDTSRTVLVAGVGGLQKYDYETRGWIVAPPYYEPNMGSPEVESMTEAEARARIEAHGGTWVVPTPQ